MALALAFVLLGPGAVGALGAAQSPASSSVSSSGSEQSVAPLSRSAAAADPGPPSDSAPPPPPGSAPPPPDSPSPPSDSPPAPPPPPSDSPSPPPPPPDTPPSGAPVAPTDGALEPPPKSATQTSASPPKAASPSPGAKAKPPRIVRNPPRGVRPELTGKGHVFPVYGPVSLSDDFGAPRITTGWHHGNDIFAAVGAPVLAVADGTLFLVGWNPVGGFRLWLKDGSGNEYYYAHLSAYSPIAVDGAHVKAGDVVGFVGDTGDARGTPAHLHFELHPRVLLGLGYDGVVDPYPYLLAWHERRDANVSTRVTAVRAADPGAIPLERKDISSTSGLAPGALTVLLVRAGEGAWTFLPTSLPPPTDRPLLLDLGDASRAESGWDRLRRFWFW